MAIVTGDSKNQRRKRPLQRVNAVGLGASKLVSIRAIADLLYAVIARIKVNDQATDSTSNPAR